MLAPRTVRDFIRWRWAPSVALSAGSLAFVALALLLIPAQPSARAGDVAAFTAVMPADRPATSPLRSAFNAAAASESVVAPRLDAEPEERAATLAAAPLPSLPPITPIASTPATPPDFSANITDRGDRPQGPVR